MTNPDSLRFTHHPLLTVLLALSPALILADSLIHSLVAASLILVTYISGQVITDLLRKWTPESALFSLLLVNTAFFCTYFSLVLRIYQPTLYTPIHDYIPLVVISSLLLGFDPIFKGDSDAPFNMGQVLYNAFAFAVLLILIGELNEYTRLNKLFAGSGFLLLTLVALASHFIYHKTNPTATTTDSSRRVRVTGKIT